MIHITSFAGDVWFNPKSLGLGQILIKKKTLRKQSPPSFLQQKRAKKTPWFFVIEDNTVTSEGCQLSRCDIFIHPWQWDPDHGGPKWETNLTWALPMQKPSAGLAAWFIGVLSWFLVIYGSFMMIYGDSKDWLKLVKIGSLDQKQYGHIMLWISIEASGNFFPWRCWVYVVVSLQL